MPSVPLSNRSGPPPTARQQVVVYGGEISDPERQELAALFSVDGTAPIETVTRDELLDTLRAVGFPVDPTYRAISSAALTCLPQGEGLRVRTRHITRIPAAAYANALLVAGVEDVSVMIAAPPSRPMTGETALVGVLEALRWCRDGKGPEPARMRLAHEQLRATLTLADNTDDLAEASATMLRAVQAVVTGRASDDTSIAAALEAAATDEGLTIGPPQRSQLVSLLSQLAELDYGAYAQSYEIRQIARDEVRLVPAGRTGGAPASART